MEDKTEISKCLITEAKCNVNLLTSQNDTALHKASEKNNLEIVKLMCDYGADVFISNHNNFVPLTVAAFNG